MSKYPDEKVVSAVYGKVSGKPFLDAMPQMMSHQAFIAAIRSIPTLPHNLPAMSTEERLQALPMFSSLFVPMDYMFAIYQQLFRAITTTYTTRTVVGGIRQTNALFRGEVGISYASQADTGSILGVPGIGKTSTIRRCLSLLPQVIEHTEYQGQPFFCKQVLYLHVECPSDCSIKTLTFNLAVALDRAIGSNYVETLTSLRSVAASALATQIKILCMTHHVGLILVDEIQNAVMIAKQNKQIKPLLKFLVELTNDTCTSVYFIGTPQAEELFLSQEHLKRRTRGVRLLPLKPDGTYRAFLEQLWPHQLTPSTAPLTDALANKLYDFSGGIPAYIVKIFVESQAQALMQGASCITPQLVQQTINMLAIKIPRTFVGGTHISDFDMNTSDAVLNVPELTTTEVPRLYVNKRGRKAVQREPNGLQ